MRPVTRASLRLSLHVGLVGLALATACADRPAKMPESERSATPPTSPAVSASSSALSTNSGADPTAGPVATTSDVVDAVPAVGPEDLAPLFGKSAPTSFVAAAAGGHWAVLCEASADTNGDGKLQVRLTQHGEFEGDSLQQVLYSNGTRTPVEEFAGADPSGRYLAFVSGGQLNLLDTATDERVTLPGADVRATRASFQPLRSVSFSDDGRRLAYLRGTTTSMLVIRDLSRQTEAMIALAGSPTYRIRFAPGGRYVEVETPVRDTNKNGRMDWLSPQRKGPAPCPSPIPTYNVWQFPGDEPDISLFDVETGKLSIPEGYVLSGGSFVVRRTEDLRLLEEQPGKPTLAVSSKECNARVLHLDPASGAILFGCSSAWGQRRQMYLRTADARVELGFDLAAYELDTALPTREPTVPLYPGNQTLLLNVRTRERWPLLDGTQVVAVSGTTALLERELQLTVVKLNPDASTTPLTGPVERPPFSGVLRRGTLTSVGPHVFDLAKGSYLGRYAVDATPLALSRGGEGLFPVRAATPVELATGPLLWHAPSKTSPNRRK